MLKYVMTALAVATFPFPVAISTLDTYGNVISGKTMDDAAIMKFMIKLNFTECIFILLSFLSLFADTLGVILLFLTPHSSLCSA